MNATAGFHDVRFCPPGAALDRILPEQRYQFGAGSLQLLHTHDLVVSSVKSEQKENKFPIAFSDAQLILRSERERFCRFPTGTPYSFFRPR